MKKEDNNNKEISLLNKPLDLLSSFRHHMDEEHKYSSCYAYGVDDDDDDYDEYEYYRGLFGNDDSASDAYYNALNQIRECNNKLYGNKRNKCKTKSTRRSKGKNKRYNKFLMDEDECIPARVKKSTSNKTKLSSNKGLLDNLTDDAYADFLLHEEKIIYYYRDLYDPYNVETFNNLNEFLEFLDTQGLSISENELEDMMSRGINHCCIEPIKDLYTDEGLFIKSERSYGDLRFECAESEDDLVYVKEH